MTPDPFGAIAEGAGTLAEVALTKAAVGAAESIVKKKKKKKVLA